jgi:poly-gamma-glutamate synthesis protein (capsule biosynthesis protein)
MGVWGGSTANTLRAITALRSGCWKVIVFAHWGEEYQTAPTQVQITAGHAFVDAGADLVVGAHPHVVESHEVYKSKAIFYSLGNLIFDQEFSQDVMQGLLVRADFGPKKTCFTLIPTAISHAQISAPDAPGRGPDQGVGVDTFCLP